MDGAEVKSPIYRPYNASRPKTNWPALFWACAFLIIIAAVFGGGGRRYPLGEMITELAALPALLLVLSGRFSAQARASYALPLGVLSAACLLILLQVIPLPPQLWHQFPGRGAMLDIAKMAGHENIWRSWSIDPQTTFRCGLSLIVPGTILLAAMKLNDGQIRYLAMLFIAMAAANLVVGMVQISVGSSSLYPYQTSHIGLPLGFFANRNHAALFMLIALALSSAIFIQPKPLFSAHKSDISPSAGGSVALLAAGIFFGFGMLATNSRTVTILLLPTLLILIYLAMPNKYRKWGILASIGGTALSAGLFALLANSGKSKIVNQLIDRFAQNEDHRFEFWPDSITALLTYFPLGTGVGTFDAAFRPIESLEIVGTHFVNSAHNEYIEVGVEAGIFGLLPIAILLGWILWKMVLITGKKTANADSLPVNWMGFHAGVGLILIALHSATDYPLRRITIMALAALLVAMVARAGNRAERPES